MNDFFYVESLGGDRLKGYKYDECHIAAQEAEFAHALFNEVHRVIRAVDNEVMYESKGSPE